MSKTLIQTSIKDFKASYCIDKNGNPVTEPHEGSHRVGLQGVLEGTTTATVNLVNADLLAKNRGLKISEVTVRGDGSEVLTSMSVALGSSKCKFSGAVDKTGRIYIEGQVRNGTPFITKIGSFDVELTVTGSVLLTRQVDQPGIVAGVSSLLAKDSVNISFMTVGRTGKNQEALMAIGIDSDPSASTVQAITQVKGIVEAVVFRESLSGTA